MHIIQEGNRRDIVADLERLTTASRNDLKAALNAYNLLLSCIARFPSMSHG